MPLSYRNQSIDFHSKSVNWFLFKRDIGRERVKGFKKKIQVIQEPVKECKFMKLIPWGSVVK